MEPDLLQDDPTRTLMRQVFGAIAPYEKTMIVMKLRGARNRKKAKTGRCEGRKPYGHYPGEKRVVERMRALRSDGLAYDKLAERLTSEGFHDAEGNGVAWIQRSENSRASVRR